MAHPLYGKRIRMHKRYKAHDEKGECHEGDRVLLIESRPLSRDEALAGEQGIVKRAAG